MTIPPTHARSHEETVFTNGNAYFAALIQDITHAKSSIDIEVYNFNNDALGQRIAKALTACTQRNVRVRVLVDGIGTPRWASGLGKILRQAGIENKIFHPTPWNIWEWRGSVVKLPFTLKAIYLLLKVNKRNHRKVCIIDRKKTYIGSLNINHKHLSRHDGGEDWQDMAVRLSRLDLTELCAAFEAAWDHMPLQKKWHQIFRRINTRAIIRLNNTRHRRRVLYKNLLYRIKKAKQRVWITNAYFIPDAFLIRRLREAAQNGVDVRLLVPRHSDVAIVPLTSKMFYASLLQAGVRIFEYLPSMLHAKTLIIDDWFLLGSSNLNHRSLLHDLEVDVNIQKEETQSMLLDQFQKDLQYSEETFAHTWTRPKPIQYCLGMCLLFLKYWL